MALIPVGQKFHTVSSTVDTTDRGSSELQSQREIYTMQDIADSVTSLKTEVINVSGAEWVGLEVATLAIKAAPGANKTIRIVSAEIKFDVDSGGKFEWNRNIEIVYTGTSTGLVTFGPLIPTNAVNTDSIYEMGKAAALGSQLLEFNKGLSLKQGQAGALTGDGNVQIRIKFEILDFNNF